MKSLRWNRDGDQWAAVDGDREFAITPWETLHGTRYSVRVGEIPLGGAMSLKGAKEIAEEWRASNVPE